MATMKRRTGKVTSFKPVKISTPNLDRLKKQKCNTTSKK